MEGALWVLQARTPSAPRLAAQRVLYTDPPETRERFTCATPAGSTFRTDRVQVVEPQADGAVYFCTRHTAYLLEPAGAGEVAS